MIVNEAALTAVDDHLLQGAAGLDVIAGGCVCCEGLPALLTVLHGLADAQSRGDAPREVMLETSGLSDPARIVAAIKSDPVLVHHIVLAEVVVLVDALHGLAALAGDPLGQRQVLAADRLVVTKAAGADASRLVATLRHLNPMAGIEAAEHGMTVPLLADPATLPEPLGQGTETPVVAHVLRLASPVDWPLFSLWLSALLQAHGDRLLRVKGVIRTPAGRLLLQAVRRTVPAPEVLPDTGDHPEDDTLVFLGTGFDVATLRQSLEAFTGQSSL